MRTTNDELVQCHETLHKMYLDLEDLHVPFDNPMPKAIDLVGAFIQSTLEHEGIKV